MRTVPVRIKRADFAAKEILAFEEIDYRLSSAESWRFIN